jgi:arylsulfatase A-like enzyme
MRLLEETGDPRYSHPWPIFREVQQIVLMVHTPGMRNGRRSNAIVQPVDVLPTTLDWLDAEIDDSIEGASFLGVLSGDTDRVRDVAVTSFELMPHRDSTNAISTVTNGRWQLHFSTRGGETELYDLESDPGEEVNVFADRRDIAKELHRQFYQTIQSKVNEPIKAELVKKLPD